MRRIFLLALCFLLMIPPVRAAEAPKFVALTFEDCPATSARLLMEGLARREVKATFFFSAVRAAENPQRTRQLFEAGHEIGLLVQGYRGTRMLSRRQIAAQIVDTRSRLPEGSKIKWIRLTDDCTDAARQVAEAKNLAILEGDANGVMEEIHDGDVVSVRSASADVALSVVDRLQNAGFRVVTVTELARVRRVHIHPGRIYRGFAGEMLPMDSPTS